MPDSLIEELPKIVAQGKKEAQKILDGLSTRNRITLQTNELVLPTKAKGGLSQFTGQAVKELIKKDWLNRMIYGDNLLAMQALLAGDASSSLPSMRGKIDLIYIDPPFDSKADYRTKIHLPSTDIESKPTVIEQFAYADTWKNGTVSYLEMMIPRLILMRELLSEQGSIYVHIDWHVGHYVKIIMDEIFGKDKFRNEIVWKKLTAAKAQSKFFSNVKDTLFLYSKSDTCYFKGQYLSVNEDDKSYSNIEEDTGKKWGSFDFTQAGQGQARTFGDKILEPPHGKHWIWGQERIDEGLKAGIIIFTKNGTPRVKKYLENKKGDYLGDLWIDERIWADSDTAPISANSGERVDYDTQKPMALLNKIINASCPENGMVGDFFAGSGTTGAVAEKLKRNWIMSDLGKPACMIMRKRLIDQDAKPFFYQSIGDYQKEQFEKSAFRTIGDLAHVVINLYGALPFPNQEGVPNNLGYIKQGKILVLVDSPSKMTGYSTLKKAQELRASFMGGWDKIVVLGWNFMTDIGRIISSLNDDKLEVLVIPPDLLDRLRTKASYEQLIKSGKVRFSSLQYLTIKPIKINKGKEEDEIDVELNNYVLLSPDALPLDEKNKEKLEKVISEDPLSLIEYWSIDPEFDGETFRSKWQEYRENNEDLRIKRKSKLTLPKIDGKRKICVKAVDVFGFESVVVQEVK